MQPNRFATARTWLAAARGDLQAAKTLAATLSNFACFHARQAAEKALKALLVALSGDVARTHHADMMLAELDNLGFAVEERLRRDVLLLEKYYVTTRYPDALGGADPTQSFDQSESGVAIARRSDRRALRA